MAIDTVNKLSKNQMLKRAFNNFLIVMGISLSSTIGTQSVNAISKDKKYLNLAFLITYIPTLFNVVLLPSYAFGYFVVQKKKLNFKNLVK